MQDIQKALAEYANMGMPPDQSAPLILQQLQANNQLTPQYEQALQSELFKASQASDGGVSRLQMISALNDIKANASGGLNPEQKANMMQLQQQAEAQAQSQGNAALQGAAMRGQAGAGNTLAAQLEAAQQGAQRTSQGAANIGAAGAQLQNQALQQYLAGLGQMRGQDIGMSEYNASAQQAADIAKMNANLGMQARNVAAQNSANSAMWQNQNYANAYNVQSANQEKQRQLQAEHQYWQDKLNLANGKANAYLGNATALGQMQNNQNQAFNTTLQGVNSLAGTYAAANKSTPNTGTDYSTADVPSSESYTMPNMGTSNGAYPVNSTPVDYSSSGIGSQFAEMPKAPSLGNYNYGATPTQYGYGYDSNGKWIGFGSNEPKTDNGNFNTGTG
jgi:hypothetical protein